MSMKTMENKRNVIGQNIKRFREGRNLSQTQLARMLWIDRTSLSGYEIGKRTPDIFMLCKMADVFDVSLDELAGRERNREKKEGKRMIKDFKKI